MIYFLTGDVNTGKTTIVSKWFEQYKQEGKSVGGFLAPALWSKGQKNSYELLDLQTGQRCVFASRKPLESAEKFGDFWFSHKGKKFGEHALKRLCPDIDVGIVDEIGPLELSGRGWAAPLKKLLRNPPQKLILLVRSSLVKAVSETFQISSFNTLTIRSPKP